MSERTDPRAGGVVAEGPMDGLAPTEGRFPWFCQACSCVADAEQCPRCRRMRTAPYPDSHGDAEHDRALNAMLEDLERPDRFDVDAQVDMGGWQGGGLGWM